MSSNSTMLNTVQSSTIFSVAVSVKSCNATKYWATYNYFETICSHYSLLRFQIIRTELESLAGRFWIRTNLIQKVGRLKGSDDSELIKMPVTLELTGSRDISSDVIIFTHHNSVYTFTQPAVSRRCAMHPIN